MADLSNSKIAIVLSGCGYLDGSDVHEVSAACSAITEMQGEVVFFAPLKQFPPHNHITGKEVEEHKDKREILVEAARVAGTYLFWFSYSL